VRKHQGLSPHRFKDNPCEKAFAKAWREMNQQLRTLDWLLDPDPGGTCRAPECSERDELVAATVVQWLGSPGGQFFLDQVGFIPKPKVKKGDAEPKLRTPRTRR